MAVIISCPVCHHRGQLPAGIPLGATLSCGCPACQVRFQVGPVVEPPAVTPTSLVVDDVGGVWVGDGIASPPASHPAPPAVIPANAASHPGGTRGEVERLVAHLVRQLEMAGKMREQLAAFENTARAECTQREQAVARDRTLLDARAKELDARAKDLDARANELDAREAELTARQNRQEEELAHGERLRAENASLRVEVTELQGRLADAVDREAEQKATIKKMHAAGHRLLKQRDELRAKVLQAERAATP